MSDTVCFPVVVSDGTRFIRISAGRYLWANRVVGLHRFQRWARDKGEHGERWKRHVAALEAFEAGAQQLELS